MKLIDSKTYFNLAKSFAGECQAYVRYKFVEYGARFNKFENIAQIIDKIAYNEFNHARMLYTKIQSASKETIANIDIVSGNGIIVCESPVEQALPELPEPYVKGREYRYGKIKLTIYRRSV